jgi:hypothetical protein
MSSTNTTEQVIVNDSWDEDKSFRLRVKKQNFAVVSVLRLKDGNLLFRVRGVFENYNDALSRTDELKKTDKISFIFVGEMGKWLAIFYDLSKMTSAESENRNELLNNYMKKYRDCLYFEEQEEKKRKENLLSGATIYKGEHVDSLGGAVESKTDEAENSPYLATTSTTSTTSTVVDTTTVDYLDEDKAIRQQIKNQDFFNCSILNVESFPERFREQNKDMPVWGLKIRGVYEEYAEASEKAEHLQKIDKFHNVFVGEVGKNYPVNVDVFEMGTEDQVYREKSLSTYMKSTNSTTHTEPVDLEIPLNTPSVKPPTEQSVVLENMVNNLPVPEAQTVRTFETDTTVELEQTESETRKLQTQLNESNANLSQLEEKLSKINELYAKLKMK